MENGDPRMRGRAGDSGPPAAGAGFYLNFTQIAVRSSSWVTPAAKRSNS